MPKVSIILPVYNRERYLSAAIKSVLQQTYQNWELLISDNCSEDTSADIASKYAKDDKRILFWRNEENIGLFRNYNKCIEKSSGEYIELFGADDIFEPACLERLVHVLDHNPDVSLATAARKLIDGNGQYLGTVRPYTANKFFSAQELIQSTIHSLSNWIVSPVMFRAKNKGGGFKLNLKLSADLEYWLNILQGGKVFYLDEVLSNYRVHPGSETSKIFTDFSFILDVLRLADLHVEHLVDTNGVDKAFRSLVMERLLTLTTYTTQELNITYDTVLSPLSQPSNEGDEEFKESLRDIHDYRRIACIALLHGIDPEQELQKLKNEKKDLLVQLEKARQENELLSQTLDERERKIHSYLNSHSWKVTAPLRKVTEKLFKSN